MAEALEELKKFSKLLAPIIHLNFLFWMISLSSSISRSGVGQTLPSFMVIAILISLLGLFGLATFTAARRTKELGIEKSWERLLFNLVLMLVRFHQVGTISILIGSPIAWYLAKRIPVRICFSCGHQWQFIPFGWFWDY